MNIHQFPSKILEDAVTEFSKLPGIGKKTALRLVLHLLRQETTDVQRFGSILSRIKDEIIYCRHCGNISDTEVCSICADLKRQHNIVCVVENIKDVLAIESTGQYTGIYHVLGAIISPMDGIGPNDLFMGELEDKASQGEIQEIILALSPTLEGDTTNFFLYRKFRNYPLNITTLAKGIAIGNDLEYTDEITLGRSLINRTAFSAG